LRILHITHSLNIGGLERVVVDLAKEFSRRGHDVHICCLADKEPLAREAERAGVTVFSLNKAPGIAAGLPFRIAKTVRNQKYDVIHTHNEAGIIYGAFAAIISGMRCIVHTEHGKEPGYLEKNLLRLAERYLFGRANHIVAVSESLRVNLTRDYGLPCGRVKVILNGIAAKEFYRPECRKQARKRLGIENGGLLIGHIARLVPLKNQKFLISVFGELKKEYGKLKLVIAGDGPLMSELRSFAADCGLSGDVLLLGERSDIPEILSAFDLFMLPSLTEGISVTLLEAMAAGIPVVASRVGGNSEIVDDNRSGILIASGETEAWVRKLKILIDSAEERMRLAKAAQRAVRGNYSVEIMADRYERLYRGGDPL